MCQNLCSIQLLPYLCVESNSMNWFPHQGCLFFFLRYIYRFYSHVLRFHVSMFVIICVFLAER
uniref:Uncharacterized protein n=1 Tax=Aegilops tauschii subsp. strangulata TaxID=200361 RepID=A0A453EAR2_AEGTS